MKMDQFLPINYKRIVDHVIQMWFHGSFRMNKNECKSSLPFTEALKPSSATTCRTIPYHTATPYRATTMTLHNNTKIQTTAVLSNAKLDAHTPFLRHLHIKCIILPRQARDKHGENSKKGPNLCSLFSLTRQSRAGEGGNVFRSDFLLMLNTESLPRQARDRHRKCPEKGGQQHQIRSVCCCRLPARKR
jgi:hypothetical protein